jgi:hypothetical protein
MLNRSFSPEMVSTTISLVMSDGIILRLTTKLRLSNFIIASVLLVIGRFAIIISRKA